MEIKERKRSILCDLRKIQSSQDMESQKDFSESRIAMDK